METKSGCKRLCMFLRWMCRHGSPVDFGLWTICDPRNLIIPLDTHVHKQALRLGLVKRRTPDLQTAIEITDRFAEIFPDDPTKGDFALFGYGVNKGKVAPVTTEPEPGEFVVAFAKVLDKRETKLSRAERDVIHTIGMTAFNKTMKKLIADEKARNNSNGDNKQ